MIAAILLCCLYIGFFAFDAFRRWPERKPMTRNQRIALAVFVFWGIILNIPFASFPVPLDLVLTRNAQILPDVQHVIYPVGLLPLLLAAGYLGVLPAVLVGAITGLTRTIVGHTIFMPFEIAAIACLVALQIQQPFKGRLPQIIRNQFVAVIASLFVVSIMIFVDRTTWFPLPAAVIIDSAIRISQVDVLLLLIEGMLASVLVIPFRYFSARQATWGVRRPTRYPIYDTSIGARVLYRAVPFVIVGLYALGVFLYTLSQRNATNALLQQVHTSAVVASEQTESILLQARDRLSTIDQALPVDAGQDEIQAYLQANIQEVASIFDEIIYIPADQVTAISTETIADVSILTALESTALKKAFDVGVNVIEFDPVNQTVSQIFAMQQNGVSNTQGVLIGRFNLGQLPLSEPINQVIQNPASSSAIQGYLVNEENEVLFHVEKEQIGTRLPEVDESFQVGSADDFLLADNSVDEQTRVTRAVQLTDNQQLIVLSRKIDEDDLRYKFIIPYSVIQQDVIGVLWPSMLAAMSMLGVVFFVLYFDTRRWLNQTSQLAEEANRIGQGDLSHHIKNDGALHELGQLQNSIEVMRQRLQRRVNQLDQLWKVTSAVASNFDEALPMDAVLNAAMSEGSANGVRIVLPGVLDASATVYAAGPNAANMQPLDTVLLAYMQERPELNLPNLRRYKGFLKGAYTNSEYLNSLVAVAINMDSAQKGVLWMGRETAEIAPESTKEYLQILASQVAVAVANAKLFKSSEERGERLATILASIQDAMVVTDIDGRLEMANETARELLRFGPFDPMHQPIDRLVSDLQVKAMFRSWAPTDTKPIEIEIDGRAYAVTHNWLGNENRVGRVTRFSDVTHFKDADKIKSDLINMVSNDLRKPLYQIESFVELLRTSSWKLEDGDLRFLNGITDNTKRMLSIVQQLLNLERAEAGKSLSLTEFDVVKLMQELLADQQPEIEQKRIKVKLREMHVPEMFADKTMISLALRNLLENAIRYNKADGQIDLSVQHVGSDVLVVIADSGMGIAPQDQEKIFERFWRVPTGNQLEGSERPDNTSAGLGLAIVRTIAQQHNGDVSVESRLGVGSTFYFKVPLRQPRPIKRRPTAYGQPR